MFLAALLFSSCANHCNITGRLQNNAEHSESMTNSMCRIGFGAMSASDTIVCKDVHANKMSWRQYLSV